MIDYAKFEGHTKDIFIQLAGYNDRDGKPLFWLSNQEKDGFARCDAELYSHAPALLAENEALRLALDQCLPCVEVLQKMTNGTREAFAIELARVALGRDEEAQGE